MPMEGNLGEILHRADSLCSSAFKGHRKKYMQQFGTHVNLALQEAFRCTEELWTSKKNLSDSESEFRTNIILGDRVILKVPEPAEKVLNCSVVASNANERVGSDQSEYQDLVECAASKLRFAAELAFINNRIVGPSETCKQVSRVISPYSIQRSSEVCVEDINISSKNLGFLEATFSKALSNFICLKRDGKLVEDFIAAVRQLWNGSANVIWDHVECLLVPPVPVYAKTAKDVRLSLPWMLRLVKSSVSYLQKQFMSHMETVVERNLAIARRGSCPGTLPLIDAYLNVKHYNFVEMNSQDGVYGTNSHPIWEVVYCCLRCGDYRSLRNVINSHLKNITSCSVICEVLSLLKDDFKMSHECKEKIKREWKPISSSCTDDYKRAVYFVFLGEEVVDIHNAFENWLWQKLISIVFDCSFRLSVFNELERLICVDYGEDYFVKSGGDIIIYFQALWMIGQLERAVDLLYRSGMIDHAVHIAILLQLKGLLVTTDDLSGPILHVSVEDSTKCELNFSRLVLFYIKPFELINIPQSLDYLYLLKDMESPMGGSLFASCVSRAVYLTGSATSILGSFDDSGTRNLALIDKYSSDLKLEDVFAKYSEDAQMNGNLEDAVKYFYAAKQCKNAVNIACDSLAKEMMNPKGRLEALKLGSWLISISKASSDNSPELFSPLNTLIEIAIFFNDFEDKKFLACINRLKKLECIPLHPDDVNYCISLFNTFTDEVRIVLPDVCLAAMQITFDEFDRCAEMAECLESRSKAIVLYTAMVPHRFPAQISSKILQISTAMN